MCAIAPLTLVAGLSACGGLMKDGGALPAYGVAETGVFDSGDADGDGYSAAQGDCDDGDDAIHPGAEETVGDGVDANCDGEDDT